MRRRASVVAFSGNRTLVMLRRRGGRDYATLIGGGIEEGETPEQAVLRELREEACLEGTIVRRLPDAAPLAIFATGRAAGWIAHALEQQRDGRLIRPRASYVPAAGP